jgi:hypothetical protein
MSIPCAEAEGKNQGIGKIVPVFLLCLAAVCLLPSPGRADLVIFKDGFLLSGKIKQDKEIFVDPLTKAWFPVARLNGFYMVDDGARRVIFSESQVADATRQDVNQAADVIKIQPIVRLNGGQGLGLHWKVLSVKPFGKETKSAWERWIVIEQGKEDPKRKVQVRQRVTFLTPHFLRLDAVGADWNAYHLTSEFGPQTLRDLLNFHIQRPKVKANLKEPDRRFLVFHFLLQAGWYDDAEEELKQIENDLPKEKQLVATSRKTLDKLRALQLVDRIERAYKAGRHEQTGKLLARLDKFKVTGDLIGEQRLAKIQSLGERYRETEEKTALANQFLKKLPARILRTDYRADFTAAAKVIRNELNHDTLVRLDAFLGLALQEERDRKKNRRPKQAPEELMALAVSGWLMGNDLAETDVKTALALWQARAFVLGYLKTGGAGGRNELLQTYDRDPPVPVDELAQMIRFLPPADPEPEENFGKYGSKVKKPVAREVERNSGKARYYLQLPPEYHHQRRYPVLLVLHSADESAKEMLKRWSALAAEHGYILAAPEWGGKLNSEYGYTEEEHARVLNTLYDLRRHFQVDSDRVFLFGFEEGGNMAYDLGLAHPDQFAGVIPMGARPKWHAIHYWRNAQYLPFYVVDGSFDGENPKKIRKQFQDWVHGHYPALYVEYKGRGLEFFEGELPLIFDWMSYKKRARPTHQLGRDGGGGIFGHEFCTMRQGDNRFYWLTTDAIKPDSLNDVQGWKVGRKGAQLTARIAMGNLVYVNTQGLGQVSVWFAPGMINFEKPVTIRVNAATVWTRKRIKPSLKTMLQTLYERGDREQLFWAKVDVTLK